MQADSRSVKKEAPVCSTPPLRCELPHKIGIKKHNQPCIYPKQDVPLMCFLFKTLRLYPTVSVALRFCFVFLKGGSQYREPKYLSK